MGLIAGLAASPHCAGMCGAFPVHLSRVAGSGRPLVRQVLFLSGKTCTYAFLGALAGMFGNLLLRSRVFTSSQHLFAYAAGAVLIIFGLTMLNLFPTLRLPTPSLQESGLLGRFYGHFFRAPGPSAALTLGLATGFLPCPITLAMAAAAAATHSVFAGIITMAGLGLGTAPALLGVGFGGTLIDARLRRIGLRGAGVVVILLGGITLLRPTGALCRLLPAGAHATCSCAAHGHHSGQK